MRPSFKELPKFINVLISLLLFNSLQVHACFIKNDMHYCTYPEEFHNAESTNWTKVYLYNYDVNAYTIIQKSSLRKIPNVQTLLVYTPNIRVAPQALRYLTDLKHLGIYNCTLAEIPAGAFESPSLKELHLYNVSQSTIPRQLLEELPNLQLLDFRWNKLKKLRANIFNSTPLSKLFLNYNQISNIEAGALANMDRLVDVGLSGNKLKSFNSKAVFGQNSMLETLRLESNQLKVIREQTFDAVTHLKFLLLSANRIERIADGAFKKLTRIKYLDLSKNQLKNIQPEVFLLSGMQHMQVMLTHLNRLTFVNLGTLRRLPALSVISVNGNPLQCVCQDELHQWNVRNNITEICEQIHALDQRLCAMDQKAADVCYNDVGLVDRIEQMYKQEIEKHPSIETDCDVDAEIKSIRQAHQLTLA